MSSLDEVIHSVIHAFGKHTRNLGELDVCEALEEFWRMKKDCDGNIFDGNKNGRSNDDGRELPSNSEISYDYCYCWDALKQEFDDCEEESVTAGQCGGNSLRAPLVCYVFLPGGSCFGSRNDYSNRTEARHSAAKIALMNSILNEHPSRRINQEFLQGSVSNLLSSSVGAPTTDQHIEGFTFMMQYMMEKTFLQYSEICNVLRIIVWAGSLKSFFVEGISRQEVLQQCLGLQFDDQLRWNLAFEVIEKEKVSPGFIQNHLELAENDLNIYRKAGRELRFHYEKRQICQMALHQIHRDKQ